MWLTGIGLVFQIIFYVLVGAGCIIWAIFGAGWQIKLWVFTHPEDCSCTACQERRSKAWRATHPLDTVIPKAQKKYRDTGGWWIDDKSKSPMGETWLSTVELEEGMTVLGRESGSVYEVITVSAREYGFAIVIQNKVTGKNSFVRVGTATAHHRIWLVRPSRKRK